MSMVEGPKDVTSVRKLKRETNFLMKERGRRKMPVVGGERTGHQMCAWGYSRWALLGKLFLTKLFRIS